MAFIMAAYTGATDDTGDILKLSPAHEFIQNFIK
jgi:hypothetical protein